KQGRAELGAAVVRLGGGRVHLQAMPEREGGTRSVCEELVRAGYRVVQVPGPISPWLALPPSWEELMGGVTASLRQQVRRRRRMLEREGSLTFRTVVAGAAPGGGPPTVPPVGAAGGGGGGRKAGSCGAPPRLRSP